MESNPPDPNQPLPSDNSLPSPSTPDTPEVSATPPPPIPTELKDLDFDDHLEVDTYNVGAVYVKRTRLLENLLDLAASMEEVHKNTIKDLHQRYTGGSRQRLARSYYQQAVSIVKRYVEVYRQKYAEKRPVFFREIELALTESTLVLEEAAKRAEKERERKAQGNVVFSKVALKVAAPLT